MKVKQKNLVKTLVLVKDTKMTKRRERTLAQKLSAPRRSQRLVNPTVGNDQMGLCW